MLSVRGTPGIGTHATRNARPREILESSPFVRRVRIVSMRTYENRAAQRGRKAAKTRVRGVARRVLAGIAALAEAEMAQRAYGLPAKW